MRSIRQIFQLSALILLSGCASSNGKYYQQAVQSWEGANVQGLIKTWGSPDKRVVGPTGNTVLVYQNQSYSAYNSMSSPAIGVHFSGTGHPVITTAPSTNNSVTRGAMTLTCITVFEVDRKGTIVDTSTQGNSCYSNQSFAEKIAKPGTNITS